VERVGKVLKFEEIVSLNRLIIRKSGGSFGANKDNTINPASLHYTLEVLVNPVFGRYLFDSLEEQAAELLSNIITRHVFYDGNKRTASAATIGFLIHNDFDLIVEPIKVDSDLITLTVGIAKNTVSKEYIIDWIANRIRIIE